MSKEILRLFITGFAMGSADIVPGVSGGTIAFISGIYQQLIDSIHTMSSQVLRLLVRGKIVAALQATPFSFLVPLAAGLLSAILLLTGVLESLLVTHPTHLWGFFFGLVVASIVIVGKRVTRWNSAALVSLSITAVVAFWITGLVSVETAATPLAFFLSGAIAVCAMILPGVSGSFLLVILGKYRQILSAIHDRDMLIVGLVVLGAIVGLATFARVLSFLFKRYEQIVIAGLIGFMVGALRKLWPWKETLSVWVDSDGISHPLAQQNILPGAIDASVISVVALCLLGAGIVLLIERMSPKNTQHGTN